MGHRPHRPRPKPRPKGMQSLNTATWVKVRAAIRALAQNQPNA